MRLLVSGGAGYIGSVVVERLVKDGHDVVAFDNLSNGHRAAVSTGARLVVGDLLDRDRLFAVLKAERFDAVLHLAAEALIDESIRDPGRFFRANVVGGINLLDAMVETGVRRLVFSSTAAVYGEPKYIPIDEAHDKAPVNAYGESKLAFERILPWYARTHGVQHVSLRYFNACGATGQYGEDRDIETHLIPVAIQAALGLRPKLQLFGTDYETEDGTCLRDYVHVADIALAHVLCLSQLERVTGRGFNIGSGTGHTNRQVIDAVRRVTGRDFTVEPAPRRMGDPARLVASADAIAREVGWRPAFTTLESMVQSAWDWKRAHPQGYAE